MFLKPPFELGLDIKSSFVLPFGLTNAPVVFMSLMDGVL
jgi:hypothetical protein